MTGWSVAIRRKDGSIYLSLPGEGIATKVWLHRHSAVQYANNLREHKLDAIVVKVDYQEPTIIGPARYVAAQIGNAKPADAGGNTHGKEGA